MNRLKHNAKPRLVVGIVLVTLICLLLITAVEISLRLFHPIHYQEIPSRMHNNVWRELLHRPSSVSGLAYERAPNRNLFAYGTSIKTNSDGMRDDAPILQEEEHLKHIVVVGDSYTYEFGVEGEETYA